MDVRTPREPVQPKAMAERAVEAGVANGRDPRGVAAACVYAAAGGCAAPVTQATVADAAGVACPTLRARWEEL